MHVSELIERILEISHDEVAPDTNLKSNALRWLNSAYHDLMEVIIPFMPQLEKEVVLSCVDGYAVLPEDMNRIVSVQNVDGYYFDKNQYKTVIKDGCLNIYINKYAGNLTLKYVPKIIDLKNDDLEDVLLLPRQFHSMLIWGALVWGSVHERGFNNQSEINLFQKKWEEAKRETKIALASNLQFDRAHHDIF